MLPSVTNTFQNGTVINGSKIDKNFQDIINSVSDGTKNLNLLKVTCNDLNISNNLTSYFSNSIGGTLESSTATLKINTVSGRTTTDKILLSKEEISIDQNGQITPSSSFIEIDSEVYQLADFSSIDILLNTNDRIDVDEGYGEITGQIPAGTYIPTALATAIEDALNLISSKLYACVFNSTTRKFTITCEDAIDILWRTGTNNLISIGKNIGFNITEDDENITTVSSDWTYQIYYSENLETITTTNYSEGDLITLRKIKESTSKIITVKNLLGNIVSNSDKILYDNSIMTLMYVGSLWRVVNYSYNH